MSRARPILSETLQRRRLIGLYVLSLVIVGCLWLNDWRITPLWTLFDTDEGTFTAGDRFNEWIYAVCDGRAQQVIVVNEGRVSGIDGLSGLKQTSFPNWCEDLPTVDHPDLEAWQAAAARLDSATRAPGAAAADVLDAARDAPVSVLYLHPITEWLRADPAHAADFLDAVATEPPSFAHPSRAIAGARRQDFSVLIRDALERVEPGDVSGPTLERWLASDLIGSDADTLEKLARAPDAATGTLAMILERIEAVPRHRRADLYVSAAPRLAHIDAHAALLSSQLQALPRHEHGRAARELLMRRNASAELPIALLTDFRRSFGRGADELEVFTAIAARIKNEPEAPLLLTSHLKDLSDMPRRMAATYLLGLDAPGETAFALAVLRGFSDLHPISRPKVVYALLLSEQFEDRNVQEACVLAVQLGVNGPERHELLAAMLRHGALDTELQARINAIVG